MRLQPLEQPMPSTTHTSITFAEASCERILGSGPIRVSMWMRGAQGSWQKLPVDADALVPLSEVASPETAASLNEKISPMSIFQYFGSGRLPEQQEIAAVEDPQDHNGAGISLTVHAERPVSSDGDVLDEEAAKKASRVRAQNMLTESGQLESPGRSTPVKTSGRSTPVSTSSEVVTQAGAPVLFPQTVANPEESVYASQYLYLSRVTDDELDAISSEAAAVACLHSPATDATPPSQRGDKYTGRDDHRDEELSREGPPRLEGPHDAAADVKGKALKKETEVAEKIKREEERAAKREEAERKKAAKAAMKEANRIAKTKEAEREKAERAAKKEAERVKKEDEQVAKKAEAERETAERAAKKEAEKVKKEDEQVAKKAEAEREKAAKARCVPEPGPANRNPDVGVTSLQREAMDVGLLAPEMSSSSARASALRASSSLPWGAASSPASPTPLTSSPMKHHLGLQSPPSPGPVSPEPSFPHPPFPRAAKARRLTTKLIGGRSALILLGMVGLSLLLSNSALAAVPTLNVNAIVVEPSAPARSLAQFFTGPANSGAAVTSTAAWNPLRAVGTHPHPIAAALASDQTRHRIKWALTAASYMASGFIGTHLRLVYLPAAMKTVSAGRASAVASVIGRGARAVGRGTAICRRGVVTLLRPLRFASKALGQHSRQLGSLRGAGWALASYPLWPAIQTTKHKALKIARSHRQRQLKVPPPPGSIRSPLTSLGSAAGGKGLWPWVGGVGAAILGFLTI